MFVHAKSLEHHPQGEPVSKKKKKTETLKRIKASVERRDKTGVELAETCAYAVHF